MCTIFQVPCAGLIQIGLDVGDQGVCVAVFVRMDDHAGRFVRKQDVLILVNDAQLRRLDAAEGLFLARRFKILVVEIELHVVALAQTVGGLGALAVDLDALETEVFVHHAAGQERHCLFQEFIQPLPAVVFCDIIFSQDRISFSEVK